MEKIEKSFDVSNSEKFVPIFCSMADPTEIKNTLDAISSEFDNYKYNMVFFMGHSSKVFIEDKTKLDGNYEQLDKKLKELKEKENVSICVDVSTTELYDSNLDFENPLFDMPVGHIHTVCYIMDKKSKVKYF